MKVKAITCKTLVRPQLEYESSVWAPHTQCSIDRIEAVQSRAARSTVKDWRNQPAATGTTHSIVRGSPSSMLQYLGWDSLEERRLRSRVTMMYRLVHGLVAIPLPPNIQWNTCNTSGHNIKSLVPPVLRVDAYRYSFFPATVTLLNNLPTDVVLSPSVDSFKNRVAAVWQTASTEFCSFLFLNCTELITVHQLFLSAVTHMLSTAVHYWQFQFYVPVPVLCFYLVRGTFSGYACIMDHAR